MARTSLGLGTVLRLELGLRRATGSAGSICGGGLPPPCPPLSSSRATSSILYCSRGVPHFQQFRCGAGRGLQALAFCGPAARRFVFLFRALFSGPSRPLSGALRAPGWRCAPCPQGALRALCFFLVYPGHVEYFRWGSILACEVKQLAARWPEQTRAGSVVSVLSCKLLEPRILARSLVKNDCQKYLIREVPQVRVSIFFRSLSWGASCLQQKYLILASRKKGGFVENMA